MLLCDLPPFLAKRLTDTLSPDGDVIGQYAACRIDALCSFCGRFGTAVLLFLFLHAAFWICYFAVCICFCLFRVAADSFASLYVSEFLIAACGVSPLRGRLKDSALKNPAALERLANFFLWVRVCGCCALEHKKLCLAPICSLICQQSELSL